MDEDTFLAVSDAMMESFEVRVSEYDHKQW
jgi:hypothetical protein